MAIAGLHRVDADGCASDQMAGFVQPVLMLDEIDKISVGIQGILPRPCSKC